jgi:hypothetical protein
MTTTRMVQPDFQPKPESWLRCCLCGLAQRRRDMDQVGPQGYICNAETATRLCNRLRVDALASHAPQGGTP